MPNSPPLFACRWRRTAVGLFALLGCALSSGCVTRRLTIRSDPPGAKVYVDNYEIGTTPVSTNFIYYGTREIRLVRDGYETQTAQVNVPPPFYQWIGLDLVAEHVVPWEIRDERTLQFQLQPQVIVPAEEILRRGEELRRSNPRAGTSPAPIPTPDPITGAPAPLPTPGR